MPWSRRVCTTPTRRSAEQRLDLLRWLLDEGVSLDQIVDAQRRGSLYRAGLDALLWPEGGGLTIADVAARIGSAGSVGPAGSAAHRTGRPRRRARCATAVRSSCSARSESRCRCSANSPRSSSRVCSEPRPRPWPKRRSRCSRCRSRSRCETRAWHRSSTRSVSAKRRMAFTTARFVIDLMMRLQFDEAVDRLTGAWDRTDDDVPRDELDFTVAFVDLAESTQLTVSTDGGRLRRRDPRLRRSCSRCGGSARRAPREVDRRQCDARGRDPGT